MSVPESSIERVGEQLTDTWKSVNFTPRFARASIVAYAIRDILPAIHQGRVDTLFVRGAERHWGTFFPDSRLVQLHATRRPGDEDLLELAAVETASHGGTVFALESDELLGESPIAATYRY